MGFNSFTWLRCSHKRLYQASHHKINYICVFFKLYYNVIQGFYQSFFRIKNQ